MYIEGWAFNSKGAEIANARAGLFESNKHRIPELCMSKAIMYGRHEYRGKWPADLDALTIAVLCDGGNTCFGAAVDGAPGSNFSCTVYTD